MAVAPAIRIEWDDNLSELFMGYSRGLDPALRFAAGQVERFLRTRAFPAVAYTLGERGGPGFPRPYIVHLAQAMTTIPLQVINAGDGITVVEFSLAPLGGWDELSQGYHQGAMIDTGDYQGTSAPDFKSYRDTTKGDLVKHTGSWEGGRSDAGLLNSAGSSANWHGDKERRREWFVNAIIHRNTETNVWADWTRTVQWSVPEDEVPEFEDVALQRVGVWMSAGVAPEWVLLEDGYRVNEPVVAPVGFTYTLSEVVNCAGRTIFLGAVRAFKEAMEQRQVVGVARIGRGGRGTGLRNVRGQYAGFADITPKYVPNADHCLALI